MAISVIHEDGRTRIVGSEKYANGMTMTFLDNDEPMPNCARLLDMKHARSWLANEGEPVYAEVESEEDMGGRGKRYSVGTSGRQTYVSGRGKVYNISAGEAEVLRRSGQPYAKSEYRRKNSTNRNLTIGR